MVDLKVSRRKWAVQRSRAVLGDRDATPAHESALNEPRAKRETEPDPAGSPTFHLHSGIGHLLDGLNPDQQDPVV